MGAAKASRVLAALLRVGWVVKRQSSSHRTLSRAGWPDYVFAFHDGEEIGPRMLARIAKHTGLTPNDLCPRHRNLFDQLQHNLTLATPAGLSCIME